MPKSSNQKLKILFLLKFFEENTDEEHPASMKDILQYLSGCGIQAERKSIYSDIEALQMLDYDIQYSKEQPSGYFMGNRDFEQAELKLLVDAVQSSKFITEKKSNKLISKIEHLTSRYEGRKLQRQVYIANRVKTDNEAVLYNIDYIHEAISTGYKIEFCYCEWDIDKKLVPRKNGEVYIVNPIGLLWDDEYYYLVGKDGINDYNKHYRVDKMTNINVSKKRIDVNNKVEFNPAIYSKECFGMFGGDEERVTIEFPVTLIGVVIDRFGRDVPIIKTEKANRKYFQTRITVHVSRQFFGWITGFGGEAVIVSPENVKKRYAEFIEDIRNSI